MEPQADLSDLQGAGAESSDQASQAFKQRKTGAIGSTRGAQSSMVDGLHARPAI